MPPTFLPVLRREVAAVAAAEQKTLGSVAFSTYYADLAAHNIHNRARDWPIERAVTEGYDRVIWVFKSVNTIGSDSARLPFRLREGMDDDDPVVDDHPLYRVLNKKANPVETGQVFRKRLTAQILLSKRGAFVEVTKSNGGSVKRLDLLPPDRTEPIPAEDGSIDHYRLTRRDGTIRNLEPDVVRWFRDPHPMDPYMGVTPLESAGMSVELDHFARLYNVTFMQNDGRPGGVLAVRNAGPAGTAGGDISETKMNRLESRFGKGPYEAGKLSVISGELSYVDLATRPRDMQYGATAKNAKIEILSAFGVPESVLGYSAERTYDNADAELYTYWTRTLPAHHEIILTGLDEDSDDNLYGFFDTSKVEVLERAARARREEARTEVEKGLRSIHSYVVLAGYGDEVEETAHTRALYVPTGKTPIPSREEDAEALGLAVPTDEPAGGPDGAAPPPPGAAPGEPTDPNAGPPAPPQPPAPNPAAPNPGLTPGRGAAAAALAALAGKAGGVPPKVVIRVERKAPTPLESEPNLAAADELELMVAAVLRTLAERWVERAIARLSSPKQRKHTRHWTPEYDRDTRVGTKALDTARAVDEDTWRVEAEAEVGPLVTAAAVVAAADLLDVFEFNPPPGVGREDTAADAAAAVLTEVLTLVGRSATEQAVRLMGQVNDADQEGEAFDVIVAGMRKTLQTRMSSWAEGLATQVATATVNGARDGAAREVNRDDQAVIDRTWFSRRDTKVRPTHQPRIGADGQTRGLDEPFIVGDTLLRFPGDPLAPFRESAGCRCFLRYRVRKTGRWTRNPFALGEGKAVRRVSTLPRDADSDGFIYDGTPRQRPAPVPVPRYPTRPSGLGSVRRRIVVRPAHPQPVVREPVTPAYTPRSLEGSAEYVARVIGGGDTLASRPPATRDLLRREGDPGGQDLLAPRTGTLGDRLVSAARDYDQAVADGEPSPLLDALIRLLGLVEQVRDTHPWLDDDTTEALNRLTSPSVRIPAAEGKAAEPRDGDDDGFVYDGTPRQRPARPRLSAAEQAADYSKNLDYRRGYKAVAEAMAPHAGDRDVLEQAVRDMEARLAGAEFNSREWALTYGALAALRDMHEALPVAPLLAATGTAGSGRRAGLKPLPDREADPDTLARFYWEPTAWESQEAEWLWAARDRIERQIDHELRTLPGLKDVAGEFIGGRIGNIGDKPGQSILGATRGRNVVFNADAFTWAAAAFNSGSGPTPGWFTLKTKSIEEVARYVAVHELGHVIANSITTDHQETVIRQGLAEIPGLVTGASEDTVTMDGALLKRILSAYGATNANELLAEAWAEYRLARTPRSLARAIGRFMEEHMGERPKATTTNQAIYLGDPDDVPDGPVVLDLTTLGVDGDCYAAGTDAT